MFLSVIHARCCSAPGGRPRAAVTHAGLRRAWSPLPPPRAGKRKKNFLYRRNQQPPSCRGSDSGFRYGTIFYFGPERSEAASNDTVRPETTRLSLEEENFGEISWNRAAFVGQKSPRRSLWFPLQPVSQYCLLGEPSEDRQHRGDSTAKIPDFYAAAHF